MLALQRLALGLLAAAASAAPSAAGQNGSGRQLERIQQTLRQEGRAIVALADAAAEGHHSPDDLSISWHNDFLKAQTGTFVPFIVTITTRRDTPPGVLLYVRLAAGGAGGDPHRPSRRRNGEGHDVGAYAFEEIYPVEPPSTSAAAVRVARGFSVPPGDYDLSVVVRERERVGERGRRLMAGVLRRRLSVPDYGRAELSTSTVMLADQVTVLRDPPPPGALSARPYVVGAREIHPAADGLFRPDEELIVVFLVYNPALTSDKHFDLEVEYHFFRHDGQRAAGDPRNAEGPIRPAARSGEVYVNRTEPQRFNPLVLGPQFELVAGQPVLAGQGVPLVDFQEGDYRLAITVTDFVSGRTIERHVTFTVRP